MNKTILYSIQKIIPASIYNKMVGLYFNIRHVFISGNKVQCPCCLKKIRKFISSGKYGECAYCGGSARHRNVYYYMRQLYGKDFINGTNVLHFAPEFGAKYFFEPIKQINYISADIKLIRAKHKIDITNIPYNNNHFDVVISIHVLEHIHDDLKAMRELYRVQKPGGISIHQVPVDKSRNDTLARNDINTNELRKKYYGHHDHKRLYGNDYPERLKKAGFNVSVINICDQLTEETIKYYGLNPEDPIYLCEK